MQFSYETTSIGRLVYIRPAETLPPAASADNGLRSIVRDCARESRSALFMGLRELRPRSSFYQILADIVAASYPCSNRVGIRQWNCAWYYFAVLVARECHSRRRGMFGCEGRQDVRLDDHLAFVASLLQNSCIERSKLSVKGR